MGVGIAPEKLANIFDVYGQITTPTEQGRGGLGIGLSVVKQLVEMHDGSVEVFSEGLGKGSEFVVRLPISVNHSQNQLKDEVADSIPQKPHHYRILVVDDNQDAVEMLETLLSMEDHTIRTAFEAKTGLEIAKEFQPEICLCDIGLPDMNGYKLATLLRELLPQTLLISISGRGQPEDRCRSIESGFDYHLVKPVQFDELLKLIQKKLPEKT